MASDLGFFGRSPQRMHKLALTALAHYGIKDARLVFLRYSENAIWRVDTPSHRFYLRCHRPRDWDRPSVPGLTAREIESELLWLYDVTAETDLTVPIPESSLHGGFVVATTDERGQALFWSLLHDVRGRKLTRALKPNLMPPVGIAMAKLHQFAREWQLPAQFERPEWNMARVEWAVERTRTLHENGAMPPQLWELIGTARERLAQTMDSLGRDIQHYGIIHADINPGNLLFEKRQPAILDFCSCGYGYYAYDIAQLLTNAPGEDYWNAFLEGYSTILPLSINDVNTIRIFSGMTLLMLVEFNIENKLVKMEKYLPRAINRVTELIQGSAAVG